tara:strand:+ start:36217 stop:36582 length:366 start_codon:yes stop_codon:yes gene_type:complete
MLGLIKGLFSTGVIGSIERIASEAISTDMETAEAKALFVKTLDPNGMMRRDLSRFACNAYGFYLAAISFLIVFHFFGLGDGVNSKEAIDAMTDLFLPITTAWGGIVGASFGVNGLNTIEGK